MIIPTVVAVVAAATVFVLFKAGAFTTEVQAEPIRTTGADPFMPSVGNDQPSVTAPPQLVASQQPEQAPPAVSGDTHGLYGGTLNNASCDTNSVITFLAAHPAQENAWAGVEGIPVSGLPDYIRTLTPVILRTDTAVTNHGFVDGGATSLHSVLQAGTAVLVDNLGVPRARCYCGNPLTPPARYSNESYAGSPWPSFSPEQVVVIQPAPTPITVFVLVDPTTNATINRPVGSDGTHDQITPTGLPFRAWQSVGGATLAQGSDQNDFTVSFPSLYWGGATASVNGLCNYTVSGQARVVTGNGYGIAVRAAVEGTNVLAQAFQYDPGAQGYRVLQYPNLSTITTIPAATDSAWHSFTIIVSGSRYSVELDGTTVASEITPLTCGGIFLRVWSGGTSEFRNVQISPAT